MDSTHNSETLKVILRGGPQDLAISEPGRSANQRNRAHLTPSIWLGLLVPVDQKEQTHF
ncbi:hypothetical protein Scep_019881 [Stephania cephalantha]|uniref:Uncharacterized protein n=1 Tax=Stephania cephalantha TaxID=152367 RepID=A0AAP0IBU6_9MAGN